MAYGGVSTAGAAPGKDQPSELTVTELSGHEMKNAQHQAFKSDGWRTLYGYLVRNGYHVNRSKSSALHVRETNGEERYVVVQTFTPKQKRRRPGGDQEDQVEYVHLVHNGIDQVSIEPDLDVRPASAYKFDSERSLSAKKASAVQESGIGMEQFVVEEGDVKTVSIEDDRARASQKAISTSSCYCNVEYTDCEDTNWACVLKLASAGLSIAGSCKMCAGSFGIATPACLLCASAVTGSGAVTLSCDIGENCSTKTECIEDAELACHSCDYEELPEEAQCL